MSELQPPEEGLTLYFRVTEHYADDEAKGKVRLSTEDAERPYAVTRQQAIECAQEHGAQFEEVSDA